MDNEEIANSIYHSLIIVDEERKEKKGCLDRWDTNGNIFVYVFASFALLVIISIFIFLAYTYFKDW